jgi:hypothetical protein
MDAVPQPAVTRNVMSILDMTGDTKVIWDPKNPDEVDAARQQFNTLKAKGFLAFSVKKDGEKGTRIKEFDPEAEKIIMSPQPLAG